MRKIQLGKNRSINIYDSINDLSIERLNEFERLLAIESGIGEDMNSVDKHLGRLILFSKQGKPDEVLQEVLNLRQNFHFIINGFSIKSLAFACLVEDNQVFNIENIGIKSKELQKYLSSVNVSELIESVKKKYLPN